MQLHNNLNLIATNQLIYINLKLYQLTLNIQQPKKKDIQPQIIQTRN
jgi:hypothetical protein